MLAFSHKLWCSKLCIAKLYHAFHVHTSFWWPWTIFKVKGKIGKIKGCLSLFWMWFIWACALLLLLVTVVTESNYFCPGWRDPRAAVSNSMGLSLLSVWTRKSSVYLERSKVNPFPFVSIWFSSGVTSCAAVSHHTCVGRSSLFVLCAEKLWSLPRGK